MDWTKFPDANIDPRFIGGEPGFKTEPRMPIKTVTENLDAGLTPEEISSEYHLELRLVLGVKDFIESQSVVPHSI